MILFNFDFDVQTVLNADKRIPHEAARSGNAQLIQFLADLEVDLVTRTKNGYTPLHWSAVSGKVDAARALLDAGVPVDARDNSMNTPLHRAAEFGQLELCRLLIDRGAEASILYRVLLVTLSFWTEF